MVQNIKRLSGIFFFVLGFFLLYFSIQKVGIGQVVSLFDRLGWEVIPVMLIPVLWTFFHTVGWYYAVEETGSHVSFWQLIGIKLAGESVNNLTPVSFMGGDSLRLFMMNKKMSASLSTASIVLDRTMISLAIVPFLILGLLVAGYTLELPVLWQWAFPVLTAVIGGLVWFFIHHQKKGLFDLLSRILSRLGFKKHLGEEIQHKLSEIDDRISHFYERHPKRFLGVLGAHFMARLCGVFEIYVIAHMLQIPLLFHEALLLASLTILVNMIFVFIPGSLGVLEGAYGALFHVMNLNPAYGIGIQLVRRVRTIAWVLIGLLFVLPYSKSRLSSSR